MRIGIDARVIHFPGIGRYIRNLVSGLAALGTEDRFTLYIAREEHRDALPAGLNGRFHVRMLPDTFSVREQWLVPRVAVIDRLDLFHTPHYVVPLFLPCPCVATLHDLTYYKHPASLRSLPARSYYRLMHRVGHRRARQIICMSESTARDVQQILGVPAAKLHTIYCGIDPRFRPADPERAAAFRTRLGVEEYLLYVGTKKRFKNVPTLLRAFRILLSQAPSLHLVLAGRGEIEDPEIPRLLGDEVLRRRVLLLEPLPDEEMPLLYSAARALVLPSFSEGFGSPLAEAMACGTPCLCADASSFPEVAGNAALFFPPGDHEELARLALRVLTDPTLAVTLSARGRRRALAFDGANFAARTYAVYQAAAGGPLGEPQPSAVGRL
jgi:glycosyltransferase involved in cell wall biosynthesis